MKIRPLSLTMAPLTLCLLLTACGSEAPSTDSDDRGVLRFGTYQPTSLDPRKAGRLDGKYLEPVFDSLITRTPDGKIQPGLATEWSLQKDNTELNMTLRSGVKFQDGTAFDAEAVKKSIEAGQAKESIIAAQLALIKSVDVLDPQHVRLNLSEPAPHVIGVLAGEAGMMISPTALTKSDGGTFPVGAGPYKVVTNTPGQIVYEAWDGYWAKDTVKNKRLEFIINSDATTLFRALQSGEIDLQSLPAAQAKQAKSAGLNVLATPTTSVWQVMINVGHPVLAKPEIRKAIMHAIDRQAISDNMFAGTCVPTVQPFAKGVLGHNDALDDPKLGFDLEKAKAYVAEAKIGKIAPLKLSVSSSTQQQQLGSILQAELAEIGIPIKVEVIDQAQLTVRRVKGDFELALSLTPATRPDPFVYVTRTYIKGGLDNRGFSLDTVEELVRKAARISDDAERGAVLGEITAAVYEAGQPVLPICNTTIHQGYRNGVSGLKGPVHDDYDWAAVSVSDQ